MREINEFLEDLKGCKNIFDLMALCYKNLVPYHSSKGNNCLFTDYEKLNTAIYNFLSLNEDLQIVNMKPLIFDIANILYTEKYTLDDHFFYNIIITIDVALMYHYPKVLNRFQHYKKIDALNSNFREKQVYIFPKINNSIIDDMETSSNKCKSSSKKGGLRSRAIKQINDSINKKLKNFIIYYATDDYCPSITILADNDTFSERIKQRQAINIGLVPLINRDIFSLFDIDDSKNDTFAITGPKENADSLIADVFIKQLEFFANKDVDIIVFPEMYLTDTIIKNISEYIHTALQPEFYDSGLKLVVAGTHWKHNSNICYVLDNYGKMIYTQNKFEPFEYNGKLEDLKNDAYIVNALDINNIGRIFTFICRDIYNFNLYNIFRELKGDILSYSAYSPSLDLESEIHKFINSRNCISIFSNACAARVKKDAIGFCAVPQKKQTSTSTKIVEYGCSQKCDNDVCSPTIVSIEYNNFLIENDILSCKVSIL